MLALFHLSLRFATLHSTTDTATHSHILPIAYRLHLAFTWTALGRRRKCSRKKRQKNKQWRKKARAHTHKSLTMRNNCIYNRSIIRAFSLINLFLLDMLETVKEKEANQCRKPIHGRDRKNIGENTFFSTSSVFKTITSAPVPMQTF